jgi:hypothetical protein
MAFGHPSQHAHMMAGVAKAAKSKKTPAHLRQHLQNRMAGMVTAPPQHSLPYIKIGRLVRYRQADLVAFLESHHVR